MTYLTRTIATIAAVAAIALPAAASTSQEDVQTCRTAMEAQASVNMNDYRLRFLHAKGNSQGRTVFLKAIPNTKTATAFRFTCELSKNQVIALNATDIVRFARR